MESLTFTQECLFNPRVFKENDNIWLVKLFFIAVSKLIIPNNNLMRGRIIIFNQLNLLVPPECKDLFPHVIYIDKLYTSILLLLIKWSDESDTKSIQVGE